MDVKTIGIEVQQKGVVATTNSLSRLTTVAQNLVKPVQGAVLALEGFKGLDLTPVAKQFQVVSQGVKDTNTTLAGISASAAGVKGLSSQLTAIASAAERMGNASPGLNNFVAQLERIKAVLESIKALGPVLPPNLPNPPGGGGGGGGGGTRTRLTDQEKLMQQLERQTMMIEGRTKAGYLELRAAQLGVTQQAEPFIRRMREAEAGLNNTGMSAKQTAWALKMVPAQFTDIATQLAGGQSPFLVMIQQGGQLRDMFQGFGNMFKAVGGMILKWLVNPWVLAAAATAAFGFAIYKLVTKFDAMNMAMALTNNYTGLTKNQFGDMTVVVAQATDNFYGAKDAMLALVGAGIRAGEDFAKTAEVVTNFSRYTGTATEDTVKWYTQIQKTPLDTLRQFDDQYHRITASTLEHVSALQRSGDVLGAVKVATDAVREAQDRMAKEAMNNANIFVKAVRWIADETSKLFTSTSQSQNVASLDLQIARQKELYAQVLSQGYATDSVMAKDTKAALTALEDKKRELNMAEKITAEEQKKKNTIRDREDFLKQVQHQNETASGKGIDRVKAAAQQLTIEKQIAQLKTLQGSIDKKTYDSTMLGLTTRLADVKKRQEPEKKKGGGSGVSALASAQAELQNQKQQYESLVASNGQLEKMTENEKKLFAQRAIAKSSDATKQQVANASKLIPVLEKTVDYEKKKNEIIEETKGLDKLRKEAETIDSTNAMLKEQIAYLKDSGATSDTRTEADKQIAKLEGEIKTHLSSQYQTQAAINMEKLLAERTLLNQLKSQKDVNQATKELVKNQTDYTLEVEAAQQAQANSLAWQHLSSAEQEKRNALQTIEVARLKEIADLNTKIAQARAEGNADNNGNQALVDVYNAQKDAANARAKGLSDVAANKPIMQSKEGTSILADAEAGYINFYNGLESRTSLMQSAFSTAFSTMSDSMATFCNTGKLDFKSFTVSILKGIQEMIIKFMLLKLAQMAVGLMGSAASASSAGTGSGIGSGAGGMTGTISTPGLAYGSANGNVFGTMTNQVYEKTTPFRFANGGTFGRQGVLGEAGPEAVMPLARTASGKLGVQTTGGDSSSGGNNIQINVTVESNGQSSESSSSDATNAKKIGEGLTKRIKDVIIEELRPNGILAKA